MGSVSLKIGDGTARFKRATLCSSALNALMLFSVVTTNLFALYAFTWNQSNHHNHSHAHKNNSNMSFISEQVSLILKEIDLSQRKLAQMEKEVLGYDNIDISRPNLANELKLFLQHHSLPLGKDSKTGITEMVASVGHSCEKSIELLSQYMSYKVGGSCPDDWSLAQKLILRGCEPLPRRRCFAKSISKVSHNNIIGFDLVNGKFVKPKSKNDFLLDDVMGIGSGSIRIGLDLGAGSGSFAALMAQKNVTVVTSTLNVDAPFIAARGLVPFFFSLDQRFPFYDNVFDLVHTLNHLGNNINNNNNQEEMMEFFMFDIDRVLRAGGLFWLDNFHCLNEEKKATLTHLIDRFGYNKLKWVVGEKVDASGKPQVYLSAVLQKPLRVKSR